MDTAADGVRGRDLGANTWLVDTRLGGYGEITAAYLILGPRPCLVETGAALSAPLVRAALAAHGLAPADLATIVVTHIHLDHAGGVGDVAADFPAAEIVVHASGARHLVDPSRLLRSAAQVFGLDLDTLFGPLRAVPEPRVRAVDTGDRVDLGGGRHLEVLHSPGHARHHVGLVDSEAGDLYVGDAAGIYVPSADLVRPSTPPPNFSLDLSLASLDAFAAREPRRLLFSHYGPVTDVGRVLEESARELRVWVEVVREAWRGAAPSQLDHAVALVRERTDPRYRGMLDDGEVAAAVERLSPAAANVAGIGHWLDGAAGSPGG